MFSYLWDFNRRLCADGPVVMLVHLLLSSASVAGTLGLAVKRSVLLGQ